MNDSTTAGDRANCEARAEDISLLAADCLTSPAEQHLRIHLGTCNSCRERFEQLQALCLDLRAAKPVGNAIPFDPRFVTIAVPNSQRRFGYIAAVVASVLVLLGLLNLSVLRPTPESPSRGHDIARNIPIQMAPLVPTVQQPTLLALRRAAEESDESLDQLLAQTSTPMFSEPCTTQSLWLETLR